LVLLRVEVAAFHPAAFRTGKLAQSAADSSLWPCSSPRGGRSL